MNRYTETSVRLYRVLARRLASDDGEMLGHIEAMGTPPGQARELLEWAVARARVIAPRDKDVTRVAWALILGACVGARVERQHHEHDARPV